MGWQDGTGEGVSLQTTAERAAAIVSESVSGDRWVQGIETAGSRSTGESQRRSIGASRSRPLISSRRVSHKVIQNRRLRLQLCLDDIKRVEDAGGDPILRNNCLSQVRDHLQVLWEMVEGDSDSESFEEMVNVLQVALCDASLDALTADQLAAIKSVIDKLYEDPDIDDQVANELTRELIEGGVDVFREVG